MNDREEKQIQSPAEPTEAMASAQEILEDESIHIIASAAIPAERAGIGIAAMRLGKDFMSDKPGFTTLEQLEKARKVQRETERIYSICFSERFENRATVKAGELVAAGAIGRVIQTIGLGPHRGNLGTRPAWFFQRERYGGILTDVASHPVDQFLFFTGSTEAKVVHSQVGNFNHPQFPELEDFGDMVLRSEHATGYIRVDWFTPDGLPTWGDGRLFPPTHPPLAGSRWGLSRSTARESLFMRTELLSSPKTRRREPRSQSARVDIGPCEGYGSCHPSFLRSTGTALGSRLSMCSR